MIAPVVHLNGTSRDRLADELAEAYDALRVALEKMAAAAPNARDYYVVPGSWEIACDEHETRMAKVREVREEIEAIAVAVADQEGGL